MNRFCSMFSQLLKLFPRAECQARWGVPTPCARSGGQLRGQARTPSLILPGGSRGPGGPRFSVILALRGGPFF